MRYLLATGAFAFLLAGAPALASAAPAAAPAAVAPAVQAPAQAPVDESTTADVSGKSPDVAQWTATLISEQRREEKADPHRAVADHGIARFAGRLLSRTTQIARNLTRDALHFIGTPYVFGGTSSSGFDCSGFVQHVFAMLGMSIPRTADAQFYAGKKITGKMRAGDLVFFQTYLPGPSHVGIYLGHGKFVHASSHGVMVSSLNESYWANRYIGAKRLIASR